MQPVTVPYEVAKAFDYHKDLWKGMTIDDINLMFMAIATSRVNGQALILKNYAQKHPTLYVHAIANGYLAERNFEKEVAGMITSWLDKPYVDDEKKDIEHFARMVTSYFQQQK